MVILAGRTGLRRPELVAVELAFNSYIAAKAGVRDEAVSALASLKQSRETRYVPAVTLCWLDLALGRDDSAMDWLMIASRDAEPYLAWSDVAPMYDSLRLRLGHSGVKA